MLDTTQDAVKAVLRADPSLTPTDRNRMLVLLRNHGKATLATPAALEPRLIRRAEAARRMGCSLRAIDTWARAGILRKVKLPGRTRAAGFRERDLVAVIEGREAK